MRELTVYTLVLGIGATLVMDLWSWLLRRFGIPTLDYAMLGRWCGHWFEGTWFHGPIQKSRAVSGEKFWGWALHYMTGIAFAAGLLFSVGIQWVEQPRLAPTLLFGTITVLFPWFILQPALGAGVAAAKAARPWFSRGISIATHLVFGYGLFACAKLTAAILMMERL